MTGAELELAPEPELRLGVEWDSRQRGAANSEIELVGQAKALVERVFAKLRFAERVGVWPSAAADVVLPELDSRVSAEFERGCGLRGWRFPRYSGLS